MAVGMSTTEATDALNVVATGTVVAEIITGTASVTIGVTAVVAGRRVVTATASATVGMTVVGTGTAITVGGITGWWNGEEVVALQWGAVPVVEWQMV